MENIKEKIAKLLSLSKSPNENEAKEALLKARELMAEHKLSPEDIKAEQERVVMRMTGITCTPKTDSWAVYLIDVIAKHYCCGAVQRQLEGERIELGIVGLEDDQELCFRIAQYAYDCVKSGCDVVAVNTRKCGRSISYIRNACRAYGVGFCAGLEAAYREQDEAHQEWGLVMSVPQPVTQVMNSLQKTDKPFSEHEFNGNDSLFLLLGYSDGQNFDPGLRVPQKGVAYESGN